MSISANEPSAPMQKKLPAKCLIMKQNAWNMTQVHANRIKQLFRHNQLLHGNPVTIRESQSK